LASKPLATTNPAIVSNLNKSKREFDKIIARLSLADLKAHSIAKYDEEFCMFCEGFSYKG